MDTPKERWKAAKMEAEMAELRSRLAEMDDLERTPSPPLPRWPTFSHALQALPAYFVAAFFGILVAAVAALIYSYPVWMAAVVGGAVLMQLVNTVWKSGGRTAAMRLVATIIWH